MEKTKKFLDLQGLLYLINNFKKLFALKADIPNEYNHPEYPPHDSGLYKITVDKQGHVCEVQAVTKNDILSLGIFSDDSFELTEEGKLYFNW